MPAVIANFHSRAAKFFVSFSFMLATIGNQIAAGSYPFSNDISGIYPKYINIFRVRSSRSKGMCLILILNRVPCSSPYSAWFRHPGISLRVPEDFSHFWADILVSWVHLPVPSSATTTSSSNANWISTSFTTEGESTGTIMDSTGAHSRLLLLDSRHSCLVSQSPSTTRSTLVALGSKIPINKFWFQRWLTLFRIYSFAWIFGFFFSMLTYYVINTWISPQTVSLVDVAVYPPGKGETFTPPDIEAVDDGSLDGKKGPLTTEKEIV